MICSIFFELLYLGNLRLLRVYEGDPDYHLLVFNAFGIYLVVYLYEHIVLNYLLDIKLPVLECFLPDITFYRMAKCRFGDFSNDTRIGVVIALLTAFFTP